MYQLILLPQTELNTPDTRNTYEMKTKHRLMPRSFGRYEILGKKFCAIESEEICIENNSLPFNDYVECRELNMTVEIAHNGGIFDELKGFCKWLEVSWFDFLMMFYAGRRSHSEGITKLYDTFREQTTEDIFDTRDELDVGIQKNMDVFLDNAHRIVALVIGQNALALGVGALAGLLVGLNRADRRAVTMEVGIQNSGLGLAILFTFFPQAAGMILIAGFWGVWHLVSGLALALIWSRSAEPMAKEGV